MRSRCSIPPVELFKAIKDKDMQEAKRRDGDQQGQGLSRVVATYDWAYNSNPKVEPDTPDKFWDVEMHRDEDGVWRMGPGQVERRGYFDTDDDGAPLNPDANPDYFCHPWNYQLKRPGGGKKSLSTNEVWAEAAHTINEVGSTFSIQGFDLNYAGVIIGPSVKYRDGQIIFDKDASKNSKATNMRDGSIDYSRENLRNELNVLLKRGVHGLYLFAVDPELQRALKTAEAAGRGGRWNLKPNSRIRSACLVFGVSCWMCCVIRLVSQSPSHLMEVGVARPATRRMGNDTEMGGR